MAVFRSMAQPCYLCNPVIPVLYFRRLRGSTCSALLWMSFGHYLKRNCMSVWQNRKARVKVNFAIICRWEVPVCLAGYQKMPYFQESMRFKVLMSVKLILLPTDIFCDVLTFLHLFIFWGCSWSLSSCFWLSSSFMFILLSHNSVLMALEIQHCKTMATRNFEYLHYSKTKKVHSWIFVLAKMQANTTPALRQRSYKARSNSRLGSNDRIQRNTVLVNIWK